MHEPRTVVLIRPFQEADRPALRLLFMASRDAGFPWAAAGTHRPEDFDTSTEGERILVAVDDGDAPIGFASIWEPDSFLHNLFVYPSHQRRGVGRALLAACAPHFSTRPTLKCLQANAPALAFYAAQGWRVTGEGDDAMGPYVLMEGPQGPAPA